MWRPDCRRIPALLCAALLLLAAIAVMAPAHAPAGADAVSGAAIVMDGHVTDCDGSGVAAAQLGCCGSYHCTTPSAALSGAGVVLGQGAGALPHRLFDATNPETCAVGAAFKPPRLIA